MNDSDEKLIRLEEVMKSQDKRLSNIEQKQDKTDKDIYSMSLRMGHLDDKQTEIAGDIKEIKEIFNKKWDKVDEKIAAINEKPKKTWEDIISTIIKTVVTGVVGYVLIKLGLGK